MLILITHLTCEYLSYFKPLTGTPILTFELHIQLINNWHKFHNFWIPLFSHSHIKITLYLVIIDCILKMQEFIPLVYMSQALYYANLGSHKWLYQNICCNRKVDTHSSFYVQTGLSRKLK